ncbi:hypothetical protein GCM10010178_62210 [Lentzea flava]|uniref:Uncharacterized protein n=2 Tax=Lentzea flava TaxID=103732 RepID=A0ABQ2V0R8_9PSEU|nr:hypothetical protein GCM10010178_62210 [Lentzea flava]
MIAVLPTADDVTENLGTFEQVDRSEPAGEVVACFIRNKQTDEWAGYVEVWPVDDSRNGYIVDLENARRLAAMLTAAVDLIEAQAR